MVSKLPDSGSGFSDFSRRVTEDFAALCCFLQRKHRDRHRLALQGCHRCSESQPKGTGLCDKFRSSSSSDRVTEGNAREFELHPERLTDFLLGKADNLVTLLLLPLSLHFYPIRGELAYSCSHIMFLPSSAWVEMVMNEESKIIFPLKSCFLSMAAACSSSALVKTPTGFSGSVCVPSLQQERQMELRGVSSTAFRNRSDQISIRRHLLSHALGRLLSLSLFPPIPWMWLW